jgi:hypothetical protein
MHGETWRVDGRFFETKNMPLSLTIFSVFPLLDRDDEAALVWAASFGW